MKNKWDCHAHIFGPYDQYPLATGRSYTPEEATLEAYIDLLDSLDIQNGVLVHPSAYGVNHGLLFDCLEKKKSLRGVMVIKPSKDLKLEALHAKGIRAARFSARSGSNTNFFGSADFKDYQVLCADLSSNGLHAELWTDCKILPSLESALMHSPVDTVIDHMGGFDVNLGLEDPGFQCLLRLLDSGKIWLKLCAYRNLLQVQDIDLGQSFHEKLIQTNPDRLVWGTDWPHLNIHPPPQTGTLLDLLLRWTPDKGIVERILTINPTLLYQ